VRSFSDSGAVRTKVIVAQVLVIVGLVVWYKVYLPRWERQKAESEARERDRRIQTISRWAVIEDSPRGAALPAGSGEQHR